MYEPDWYLEVGGFKPDGSHSPLACYGPFSYESANVLLMEYNATVLPIIEKAFGAPRGTYSCGIVNRKRYEVMIRPDFFVNINGITGASL